MPIQYLIDSQGKRIIDSQGNNLVVGKAEAPIITVVNRDNYARTSGVTVNSQYSAAYSKTGITDGERRSIFYGQDGGWSSVVSPSSAVPAVIELVLPKRIFIDEFNLVGMRDDIFDVSEPTLSDTGTQFINKDFKVEVFDNGVWTLVESVTDNKKIWYQNPVNRFAEKVRITITRSAQEAVIIEVEVWGVQFAIVTNSLRPVFVGKQQMVQMQSSGAATWSIQSSSLPSLNAMELSPRATAMAEEQTAASAAAATITSTGLLTYSGIAAGSFDITVSAVSPQGFQATRTYTIVVSAQPYSKWMRGEIVPKKALRAWHALDNAKNALTVADFSLNERDLVAGANPPVLQQNILNGNSAVYFDGTNTPLQWQGTLLVQHLFLVVKIDGETFNGYEGIFSDIASHSLLFGGGPGQSKFYNLGIGQLVKYRKNSADFPETDLQAPMNEFGIIELFFPQGLYVDGLQIGQDLKNVSRKFKGYFVEQLVYSEEKTSCERMKIYEYFAQKFNLWRKNTDNLSIFPFPFNRSSELNETDLVEISEAEGLRGRDRIVRYLDDEPIIGYNLHFEIRRMLELQTARNFLREHRVHIPYWIEDIERERNQKVVTTKGISTTGVGTYLFNYDFDVKSY